MRVAVFALSLGVLLGGCASSAEIIDFTPRHDMDRYPTLQSKVMRIAEGGGPAWIYVPISSPVTPEGRGDALDEFLVSKDGGVHWYRPSTFRYGPLLAGTFASEFRVTREYRSDDPDHGDLYVWFLDGITWRHIDTVPDVQR